MTKINKVESLVDALAYANKAYQADSKAYKLRNPIMLRNFAPEGKHPVTEDGYRIFDSYLAGYKGAVWDISKKLAWTSNSGITNKHTLVNLLLVLGVKTEEDIMSVIYFLRKSIDPVIDKSTPLTYFEPDRVQTEGRKKR